MKLLPRILTVRLRPRVAFSAVALALICATFAEHEALYRIDTAKPKKTSCIRCHTDKKTLAGIVSKSGDPLYLVHSGDLTEAQLKALESQKSDDEKPGGKSSWKSY